ncbi:unnamed protein product [Pleuronectes platessa]|uniref:Uncharacterized protein n=1 Tax=Pleuronectes platessa TaxID=8262 RepID=A0A9N7VAK6_PLEPL|nr:unnamed protein product [Pleuronectes platessa]
MIRANHHNHNIPQHTNKKDPVMGGFLLHSSPRQSCSVLIRRKTHRRLVYHLQGTECPRRFHTTAGVYAAISDNNWVIKMSRGVSAGQCDMSHRDNVAGKMCVSRGSYLWVSASHPTVPSNLIACLCGAAGMKEQRWEPISCQRGAASDDQAI